MNPQQKHIEILAKVTDTDEVFLTSGQDDECITPNHALQAMHLLELSHASQIEDLQNQIKDLQGQVERLQSTLRLQEKINSKLTAKLILHETKKTRYICQICTLPAQLCTCIEPTEI